MDARGAGGKAGAHHHEHAHAAVQKAKMGW